MYDWAIRQPYETPARVASTPVPALIDILPATQRQFLQQRLTGECDGVYVIQAGQAAWGFTVAGKTVTYHAVAPEACDACVRADAEHMILLTMGRAAVVANRQSDALTLQRHTEQGMQFCAVVFRAL